MIDYRQLEALGTVIKAGGFDRASQVLGLTQSAVTQRVKQMETFVGKPLLIRSNPPAPTEAGLPLYAHFKKIRLLEEDLEQAGEEDRFGNTLSLGVNASTLASWFHPVLRHTMKTTLVDLHVGEAKVVHRQLQQGDLAGCISLRSQPSRGCHVEFLGNMILRCVASREFRDKFFTEGIIIRAMEQAPAVLFHPESQMLRLFQKLSLGVTPRDVPTHIIPSQRESLMMISEGTAYGFIPESLLHQHQADYDLIDLMPLKPIVLPQYWHRWGIESKKLEAVTARIREEAGKSLA